MNINEGRGGDIVQVLDNRIIAIGRIDPNEERPMGKEQGCTTVHCCVFVVCMF